MEDRKLSKLGYPVRRPYPKNRKRFYPSRHRALYGKKHGGGLKPGQHPKNSFPSKLTDDQVRWIKGVLLLDRRRPGVLGRPSSPQRRHLRPGLKARLAAKFGVSIWTIAEIDRGRRRRTIRARRFTEHAPPPAAEH